VDVRRHPGSRRVPWTTAGEIERALPLAYNHLPALGGRRRPTADSPNGGWESDQFRGYADHMRSPGFRDALAELERLARERTAAVMCAEAQWWRCHRRLLADALLVRGWEVLHVGSGGGLTAHELTGFAVVEGGRLAYPPAQQALEVPQTPA
jgi:uncharacterized protein (DUF488 family)